MKNQVFISGIPMSTEFQHVSKGNNYYYQCIVFPIPKIGTSANGSGYLFIDITQAKKREETIRNLRSEVWFHDRVANTAIIAKSLAHEISQPVTAILNNAQAGVRYLENDVFDNREIEEIFEDVVLDEKRAAKVINGLRSMLQQQKRHSENVLIDQSVNEIFDLLYSELVQKEVLYKSQLDENLMVWINKIEFQQVVLDLMIYAINTLTLVRSTERKLVITANVSEAEALISLWHNGVRTSQALTDELENVDQIESKDSSLGLDVCKSIVESYEGKMWVETDSRIGETFYFTLPLASDGGDTRTEGSGD